MIWLEWFGPKSYCFSNSKFMRFSLKLNELLIKLFDFEIFFSISNIFSRRFEKRFVFFLFFKIMWWMYFSYAVFIVFYFTLSLFFFCAFHELKEPSNFKSSQKCWLSLNFLLKLSLDPLIFTFSRFDKYFSLFTWFFNFQLNFTNLNKLFVKTFLILNSLSCARFDTSTKSNLDYTISNSLFCLSKK